MSRKRDVTAPVEVLEAGRLVGVIDEPRRRRVEVAAAAVAVHEQVLTSGQRGVLSLVDLLEIEGDHGFAGDEVPIGVDTFARKVSLADPDIGHATSVLGRGLGRRELVAVADAARPDR
jgi:alpha-D-ribose 1-methylphosphonate 5-triphosphate synthase subunit PhnG